MAEFTITKDEHDQLKEAAASYTRVTGKNVDGIVGKIPVGDSEKDKEAEAKAKDAAYKAQAELNARVEATQQAERQARAAADAPAPPVAPLATERAKAAQDAKTDKH